MKQQDVDSRPVEAATLLGLFPPFLRLELVNDDEFRARIALKLDGSILLDDTVRFSRGRFFAAVRAAYADIGATTGIEDETGKRWELQAEAGQEARTVIKVSADEREFLVRGIPGLHPDQQQRMRDFGLQLSEAGHPPYGLQEWRSILEARPLENAEVRHFDADLNCSPVACADDLDAELNGATGNVDTMVPPQRTYYERLCGAGDAEDVRELAQRVVRTAIADYLAWDQERGARMALLLSSHPTFISESALADLPPEQLIKLGEWARDKGDLLSKIGMVDLGLATLPRVPHLAAIIHSIVEEICALDTSDTAGRLHLMMSMFVFVDGELSRSKVLSDWPPFRRRFAALAQAALFERVALGRLDPQHFSKWAIDQRARQFYLQTLVDLRLEPRWLPDYAGPDQLKHELIGRIYNASNRYSENIPEGRLLTLLKSKEPGGLLNEFHFPGSLYAGPLEGSNAGERNAIQPEFEAIIDEALDADRLQAQSVIALINASGLFNVKDDKIDRAVRLIRASGHRFWGEMDVEKRDTLLTGLAAVACSSRSVALAEDLRIMMRKNRIEADSPPRPGREFLVGLTAAAAFSDLEPWLKFVGDWANELAFTVDDKDAATELQIELRTLCVIEPALRKSAGRGLAALESYLAI